MPKISFRSLSGKLTTQYAILFGLAMLCVATALHFTINTVATVQVENQLVASGQVYDRLWRQRSRQLEDAAQILAADFGFLSALATGDKATVSSALDNLKSRLKVDGAFVVGVDGSVTGLSDPKLQQQAAALWEPLDAGHLSGVVTMGGRTQQLSAAPILAPQLMGWIVFSADINAAELTSLQKLSAIPLKASVLVKSDAKSWRGVAGVFSNSDVYDSRLIDSSLDRKVSIDLAVAGEDSIALARPLPSLIDGTHASLLLVYPRAAALAPYGVMQIVAALVLFLCLLGVVYATWKTAGRIARPIVALDEASTRFAAGEHIELKAESDDEIGRLVIGFNHMVSEIQEREKRIAHLAFNDVLTGLPNRTMFHQQLDYHLRTIDQSESVLALYYLDLDHFKSVNDTLGHPVGDALLVAIGERLSEAARNCFVARLGGDEFVILQLLAGERRSIERLARDIVETVQKPLIIEGHSITPGTSVGIAIAREDGDDIETLMRSADLALYRAKESGRGTYVFFEESLNEKAQARRRTENELRVAIERGELELHFQPLFDLEKDRIGSFEALLRWRHPERGMVSPLEFIPIAEETGLIVPIGEWALHDACRQATTWPEHVRVAVNVSSVQFRRPGLEGIIKQALAMSGLAPQRLEIEITESIFLDDSDETLAMLHRLRAIGIRIALDDFGTGYSSLAYLQRFPFDKIKIDRSFIQDIVTRPGAKAIVKAITDLASAMGMETTAEGVEETEQLNELRTQGCSSIQGFLFSKPLPASEIGGMFANIDGKAQKAA